MQILGRLKVHMPKNKGADADPDVEQARKKVLIAEIERKERIQSILDYTGLIVRIVFGLTSLTVAALEFFYPTLLHVYPSNPGIYLAMAGASLGINQMAISKINKASKDFK
jgi:hypothetical protein